MLFLCSKYNITPHAIINPIPISKLVTANPFAVPTPPFINVAERDSKTSPSTIKNPKNHVIGIFICADELEHLALHNKKDTEDTIKIIPIANNP